MAAYEAMEMEKRRFLQILHHDKKGGQMIRLRIDEKKSEQRSFCDIDELAATGTDTAGYYVTVNTFRGYTRESSKIFNFTSIYIDIDCHRSDDPDIIEDAKKRTMDILQEAYASGTLTIPTMITDTGRGFGLQYVLNKSIANTWRTETMIAFFKKVRKSIFEKYKEILSGDPMIEVDAAVLDDSRVCRLPGTYNVKAGRYCRLIGVSEKCYELSELVQGCHLWNWKSEEEYKKEKEEREKKKKQVVSKPIVSFAEYKMPFLSTRLEQLERLQEMRGAGCEGCREQLLFIAYSALKQLDPVSAALRLYEMNRKFLDPLPQTEVDHIVQETDQSVGIDHSGYYKLSNSYVVDTLGLTDAEINTLGIGQGLKRSIERQAARDKKKETRKKIIELLMQADSLTYDQIAEAAGVSRRTVCTIAKNEGLMRYAKAAQRQNHQKQTAEIIAIDSVREGERQVSESANSATESMCVPLLGTSGSLLATPSVRGAGGEGLLWYDWLYDVAAGSTVAAELLAMYRWSFDSAGFFHRDLNDYLDRKMPYYMRHPDKLVDIRDLVARKFFRDYGINECAYLFGVYNVVDVLPTVWKLFQAAGQREEQKEQKLEQKRKEKKQQQHLIVDVVKETPEQRKARIERHLNNYKDQRFEIIERTDEYKRRLDPDVLRVLKTVCMQVGRLKRDYFWIEKKQVLTQNIKQCFDSLTYKDLVIICERMAHQGTIQGAERPFYYVMQTIWKYKHPDAAADQADRIKEEKAVANGFKNFQQREYDFDFGKFMEINSMREIIGQPPLSKEEYMDSLKLVDK